MRKKNMDKVKSHRLKVLIVLAVEFIAIAVMLVLIFFAGRKTYTVTFDLNGGTLLGGDTVQTVTQGNHANPPSVTKEGCYFLRWSHSYREVTRDLVIKAIWEYETTEGIEYEIKENSNYCEIVGCYKELSGDVYIGAYFNEMKVLGIKEGAFKDCKNITGVYLLDGILAIEDGAFEGCDRLQKIEIPSTLITLGKNAFKGCTALEEIKLPESLERIGDGAFQSCDSLKEIILPKSLAVMGSEVFDSDTLLIKAYIQINEIPSGWATDWCLPNTTIEWGYVEPEETEDEEEEKNRLWG